MLYGLRWLTKKFCNVIKRKASRNIGLSATVSARALSRRRFLSGLFPPGRDQAPARRGQLKTTAAAWDDRVAIVLFGAIGGWGTGQYIQYIKGPSRVDAIGTTIACAFTGAIIASLFWRQPAIGLLEGDILVETVVSALIGGGLLLLVALDWRDRCPDSGVSATEVLHHSWHTRGPFCKCPLLALSGHFN